MPNPRVNLTRYHGAINNNWRPPPSSARASDPGPSRSASSGERGWAPGRSPRGNEPLAQRLKRVFKIDIETCETGGGTRKVIASIEDPAVIKRSWPLSTTAKARGNTPSTHHGRRRRAYCPA